MTQTREAKCSECGGSGQVPWTTTTGCAWICLGALVAGIAIVAIDRWIVDHPLTDLALVTLGVLLTTSILFWATGRVRIQCPICMGQGTRPDAGFGGEEQGPNDRSHDPADGADGEDERAS